ncbi:MAG: flagellar basal body rod protein FlgB [Kofleriaceae bacterium]
MANEFSSVDKLQAAMTFHRERHAVLAGNVANVDTPGFRPFDLTPEPAGDAQQLTVTQPGMIGSAPGDQGYTKEFSDEGQLQTPDGNHVQLERELAKIDANRTRYATAAELVSRRLALLRYAAGDGT